MYTYDEAREDLMDILCLGCDELKTPCETCGVNVCVYCSECGECGPIDADVPEEHGYTPKHRKNMVAISAMYVQCALQVRNFSHPGIAMSDCCRNSATSGVVKENGVTEWRCRQHEGLVRAHPMIVMGNVVYEIERNN